jgi:hypothetical protein
VPASTQRIDALNADVAEDPVTQDAIDQMEETGDESDSGGRTDSVSSATWRNLDNPYDVDGVDGVTPLDVLIIVNYINAHPGDMSLPDVQIAEPPFYDVSGDGLCTPHDVLLVINFLDSWEQPLAEGEAPVREHGPSSTASVESLSDTSGPDNLRAPRDGIHGQSYCVLYAPISHSASMQLFDSARSLLFSGDARKAIESEVPLPPISFAPESEDTIHLLACDTLREKKERSETRHDGLDFALDSPVYAQEVDEWSAEQLS